MIKWYEKKDLINKDEEYLYDDPEYDYPQYAGRLILNIQDCKEDSSFKFIVFYLYNYTDELFDFCDDTFKIHNFIQWKSVWVKKSLNGELIFNKFNPYGNIYTIPRLLFHTEKKTNNTTKVFDFWFHRNDVGLTNIIFYFKKWKNKLT